MTDAGKDARLRRDALQIVLQLPADNAEALVVLKYAEQLVRGFLGDEARPPLRLV